MTHVSAAERRNRLARRHGLGQAHRYRDLTSATTAMTAWHSTEPASVHLAIHARTDPMDIATVEGALYADRSLVKQLAMRRTLFALPRHLLGATLASVGARVARMTETQLTKTLRDGDVTTDPQAWIAAAEHDLVALLADGIARTSAQVAAELPELARRIEIGRGRKWASTTALTPTVLALFAARGLIMRGGSVPDWRRSLPHWTTPGHWLGTTIEQVEEQAGYAALVAAWLQTFGPGTEADLVWWLGATKTAVRRALADVGARQVRLDDGAVGWLHADDDPSPGDVDPWAALLPTLDPTTMGWRERGFYLDPADVPYLFDTAGNAVTTVWVDGRIVGTWVQDEAGRVVVRLRHTVPVSRRRLVDAEAERLALLLDGRRIGSPYTAALGRGVPLP